MTAHVDHVGSMAELFVSERLPIFSVEGKAMKVGQTFYGEAFPVRRLEKSRSADMFLQTFRDKANDVSQHLIERA